MLRSVPCSRFWLDKSIGMGSGREGFTGLSQVFPSLVQPGNGIQGCGSHTSPSSQGRKLEAPGPSWRAWFGHGGSIIPGMGALCVPPCPQSLGCEWCDTEWRQDNPRELGTAFHRGILPWNSEAEGGPRSSRREILVPGEEQGIVPTPSLLPQQDTWKNIPGKGRRSSR